MTDSPSARQAALGWATLLALALLLFWDASGLDLPLARMAGDAQGFPVRHHWLFTHVLHDGMRRAAWLVALGLALAVWWPVGPLRRLPLGARLQLSVSALLAALAVSFWKGLSATSCPWDLQDFGGAAHYVSHWASGVDGGSGHCFPAGHATSGFSFVAGYFVYRERDPAVARRWLWGSLALGLVLGLAQQMRGAHFMSHTLWSGWICWCVAYGLDQFGWERLERQPA